MAGTTAPGAGRLGRGPPAPLRATAASGSPPSPSDGRDVDAAWARLADAVDRPRPASARAASAAVTRRAVLGRDPGHGSRLRWPCSSLLGRRWSRPLVRRRAGLVALLVARARSRRSPRWPLAYRDRRRPRRRDRPRHPVGRSAPGRAAGARWSPLAAAPLASACCSCRRPWAGRAAAWRSAGACRAWPWPRWSLLAGTTRLDPVHVAAGSALGWAAGRRRRGGRRPPRSAPSSSLDVSRQPTRPAAALAVAAGRPRCSPSPAATPSPTGGPHDHHHAPSHRRPSRSTGLTKSFGRTRAVDGVDLTAGRGVVGPARPERRRQDHAAADARHRARPRRGQPAAARPRPGRRRRAARDPPPARLPAAVARPLPAASRRSTSSTTSPSSRSTPTATGGATRSGGCSRRSGSPT